MLFDELNPYYYSGDAVTVSSGSTWEDIFRGAAASAYIEALTSAIEDLTGGAKKTTRLAFLLRTIQNTTRSNIEARRLELEFDDTTGTFTMSTVGEDDESLTEFATDIAGETALALALAAFIGPGTGILAAAAIAATASVLWSLIDDTSEDVLDLINGTVPTDIQILDWDGNLKGGALFEEGLSREDELTAIKRLLGRTILSDFPSISIGDDRIRVAKNTNLIAQDDVFYRIYDGEIVDILIQELDIDREALLDLGSKNGPNTNKQIYYNNLVNPEKFIFASEENRFFIPLPNINGEIDVLGIHPGNIIAGSDGNDFLDAFENSGRHPDLLLEDVVMLGLDGDDIIKGNLEKDIIIGGIGNDVIDGAGGRDIAVFSDVFENYDYSTSEDGTITISHARGTQTDGTDTLTNVEFARFADETIPLPWIEPTGKILTFKYTTTLDASLLFTTIELPEGIVGQNPQIEITYTFADNMEDKSPSKRFGAYKPITGTLSINGQTTALDYGNIDIHNLSSGNDSYQVFLSSGGSLFGYDIGYVDLTITDFNHAMIVNDNLLLDPKFVVDADIQDLMIRFNGQPESNFIKVSENIFTPEDQRTAFSLSVERVESPNELPDDNEDPTPDTVDDNDVNTISQWNGDSFSDIAWINPISGRASIWTMENRAVKGMALIANDPLAPNSQWKLAGVGSFDSDDLSDDLVWYRPASGDVAFWYHEGAAVVGSAPIQGIKAGTHWHLEGTGDFDGDTKRDDLLWRNRVTGALSVWTMEKNQFTGILTPQAPLVSAQSHWQIEAIAALDGDGLQNDLVWRFTDPNNPNGSRTSIWFMNGVQYRGAASPSQEATSANWHMVGAADFDGDRQANDLLWFNGSRSTAIWNLNGRQVEGSGLVNLASAPNWIPIA